MHIKSTINSVYAEFDLPAEDGNVMDILKSYKLEQDLSRYSRWSVLCEREIELCTQLFMMQKLNVVIIKLMGQIFYK